MPTMPHPVARGAFLGALGERYSRLSVDERLERIHHIGRALTADQPFIFPPGTAESAMAQGADDWPPEYMEEAARVRHILEDWFGRTQSASGVWQPQTPLDPAQPSSTGWWNSAWAEIETIFGETLIRALEASLGLRHRDRPAADESFDDWRARVLGPSDKQPSRRWPLDFTWVCEAPAFTGWVTWRAFPVEMFDASASPRPVPELGKDDDKPYGLVTVCFSTPGTTHSPLSQKLTFPSTYTVTDPATGIPIQRPLLTDHPDYEWREIDGGNQAEFEHGTDMPNGHRVVGHRSTTDLSAATTGEGGSAPGTWHVPVSGEAGRVVIVQPAEDDGGLLELGRI